MFMMLAPLEGWRRVKAADRRAAVDYAHVLKELADIHFAQAKTIVLVQDNLNAHAIASLYEAFPAAAARRLVERFEWRYTPKHGSWLDLAETELAVPAPRTVRAQGRDVVQPVHPSPQSLGRRPRFASRRRKCACRDRRRVCADSRPSAALRACAGARSKTA